MAFILKKIADEGTAEPFVARIWIGILELAHEVLKTKLHLRKKATPSYQFDVAFEPLLEALQTARTSAKRIQQIITDHKQKVSNNEIVRYQRHAVEITDNIDPQLRDNIAALFINGVIAIKDNIQIVLKQFPVNIGCLYQKQSRFEKGILDLQSQGHSELAHYLENVRTSWSEHFIQKRIALEHEGWVIPRFEYKNKEQKKVEAIEPQIDGIPVSDYVQRLMQRILSFTENILVYAFKSRLSPSFVIFEIPESYRDPNFPRRFRILLKVPGVQGWNIQYSETDFP